MEPITIAIISALLLGLTSSASRVLFADLYKNLKEKWKYAFSNHTLLIFGGRGAGKTSLIYYMVTGTPYVVKDGRRIPPDPTASPIVIGKNVKVGAGAEKVSAGVPMDVGGDRFYRDKWREFIDKYDPDGIVYLVRGDVDDQSFRSAVEDLFDDVFVKYRQGLRNLKALHVFVSFADKWAKDKQVERRKLESVRGYFWNRVDGEPDYKHLEHLKFEAHATQLGMTQSQWHETDNALTKFAADLSYRRTQ
jgi:hypothetical protein